MVCSRNPPEPQAGSITYSLRLGLSIRTHISTTWRGVKNCPFFFFASVARRYSKASSITRRFEPISLTPSIGPTQTCKWRLVSSMSSPSRKIPDHCSAALWNSEFMRSNVMSGSRDLLNSSTLSLRFSWASFSSQILAKISLKISLNSSLPLLARTSSSKS